MNKPNKSIEQQIWEKISQPIICELNAEIYTSTANEIGKEMYHDLKWKVDDEVLIEVYDKLSSEELNNLRNIDKHVS